MEIDDLIARIREAPDDDGPRLVLADALIERGDPWGELIVLSCQLDETSDAAMIARHDELYGQLWGMSFGGMIDRGFFQTVALETRDEVERARGPAFALAGALRAEVDDDALAALADSPLIAQVGELELDSARDAAGKHLEVAPDRVLAALANARCHTFTLNRIGLARADIEALFALPMMAGLRSFQLSGHPRLGGLLHGLPWPALESLELSLGVESNDVIAVLASPQLRDLRRLDLACNPIDDAGLHAIARTPFTRLEMLDLDCIDMSDDGLDALLASPALRDLTRIEVGVTSGVLGRALPKLAQLTRLTDLAIHCESSPAAVVQLYRALETPLDRLRASFGDVAGVERMPPFERPAFKDLRILDLSFETLSIDAVRRLAEAELPKLERLDLAYCDIGPEGAAILAASPTLPRDLYIWFNGNQAGAAAEALQARFPKASL